MTYAQYRAGNKLHLVCQPGEETPKGEVIRIGYLSDPICGQPGPNYRMTINVPLANACRKCLKKLERMQP